ncbi:phosphotransferase [Nocardioides sp. MAHUQ-72]|uniref:phosphotransferase n=1 Tax=unclassified Nocardioides TaxID=2615069 RepID=UPI003618FD68
MIPTTIPHGRTARRLEWAHLPPHVRALIERRTGSPVVSADSQTAGFTPGFASVLTCADGGRHFVKAASLKAQRPFAESYREEARKLRALPGAAPAPRLLWTHDGDDWVVLGTEYVDARRPRRPWRERDLEAALTMLGDVASSLTPAPVQLGLDDFATEFADWPAYWDVLRTRRPDLSHLDEAAALATRFAEVTAGTTVVHTDVRDDNILLAADGRVLMCDWNWPVVGAAWLDTLLLLIGPRGDGLDVEAVLATNPLTREVPAEHVDIVLALVTGYFLKSAGDPVPPTSPYVRDVQRWQGEVVWEWLCERRGWA